MATPQVGTPCPYEGCTEGVVNGAMIPRIDGRGRVVEPHNYAVCQTHYAVQWEIVYSEQFGGITHAEYLAQQDAVAQAERLGKIVQDLRALRGTAIWTPEMEQSFSSLALAQKAQTEN